MTMPSGARRRRSAVAAAAAFGADRRAHPGGARCSSRSLAPLLAPHDPNAIDALPRPRRARPGASLRLRRPRPRRAQPDALRLPHRRSRSPSAPWSVALRHRRCRSGSLAGYSGGWVDQVMLMRPLDMLLALPALLLAITPHRDRRARQPRGGAGDRADLPADPRAGHARVGRWWSSQSSLRRGGRARGWSSAARCCGATCSRTRWARRSCRRAILMGFAMQIEAALALPRPRHPAADPVARADALRRPRRAHPGALGRDLPRPGHRDHRARLHSRSATDCAATSTREGWPRDRRRAPDRGLRVRIRGAPEAAGWRPSTGSPWPSARARSSGSSASRAAASRRSAAPSWACCPAASEVSGRVLLDEEDLRRPHRRAVPRGSAATDIALVCPGPGDRLDPTFSVGSPGGRGDPHHRDVSRRAARRARRRAAGRGRDPRPARPLRRPAAPVLAAACASAW